MDNYIAVSWSEYEKYGCVKCGCEYCFNSSGISGGGATPAKCGECGETFTILADGLEISSIGFGFNDGTTFHAKLHKHPRTGIIKHKYIKPDIKPDGEGEFFRPRGVGYDLAGFVECKESGERIIKMFEVVLQKPVKTWLDYREYEPNWIQVKVQAEDGIDLEKLCSLTKDGIITIDMIKQSIM